MALIVMAVHDTEQNDRTKYTKETIMSLRDTVDWKKHRLVISDNGSCEATQELLKTHAHLCNAHVIHNVENLGTAKAVNRGLKLRRPEEYCIKIDNDVRINSSGWADEMEDALNRATDIGVLGLKRKDVDYDGQYLALPHVAGQTWLTIEKGQFILGTCTMLNWRLLDKIGGFRQPDVYGLEDILYCLRATKAGFYNAYMPHINIDHLDDGANSYTKEKQDIAAKSWSEYQEWYRDYENGTRQLWEEFE